MGKLWLSKRINFALALSLIQVLSTVLQTRFTCALCVKKAVLWFGSLLQIFIETACCIDSHSRWKLKIGRFCRVWVSIWGEFRISFFKVGWFQWWLRSYSWLNAILWSFWSEKNSRIFGQVQAIIDSILSKKFLSIAIDMGVHEFLIRIVVLENIKFFSYKGWILSVAMKY